MGPIATAFSNALWVTLGITMLAALLRTRALQLLGATSFIFGMFWLTQAIKDTSGPPWSMAHYAPQDLATIALLLITWGERRDLWKLAVSGLLLLQIGLHATFWGLFVANLTPTPVLWWYIAANNLGLAAILAVLGGTGGFHVFVGLRDLWHGPVRSSGGFRHSLAFRAR